ncbi:superoxide dismutase [Acidicapsa ligni]|uniref:superoxide dismutase n=1 Tax=Acidicapsa ligni TaxID=542300 RepID=UPI0021DF4EAE|nr:superoxide dismutase [Acidicapsa ligni]
MNRRTAIKQMGGLASAVLLTESLVGSAQTGAAKPQTAPTAPAPTGPFTLPPLPYAYDALEPYFDAETMHLHHDKHHQSYVDKLNAAVAGHPDVASKSVNELVADLGSVPEDIRKAVRNQGGGHANHSFWWTSLGKGGSGPTGEFAKAIDAKFGSFSGFQDKLSAEAAGVFGSGWAWLVILQDGSLEIESTPNQDSPLTLGYKPVLGIDVWEHAYYLKYKNKRPDYVKAYFSAVNWDAASARYTDGKKAV